MPKRHGITLSVSRDGGLTFAAAVTHISGLARASRHYHELESELYRYCAERSLTPAVDTRIKASRGLGQDDDDMLIEIIEAIGIEAIEQRDAEAQLQLPSLRHYRRAVDIALATGLRPSGPPPPHKE